MNHNKYLYILLAGASLMATMSSCDDEERDSLNAGIVSVEKVTLDKHELGLTLGADDSVAVLKAVVTPSDATYQNVNWASTEPTVAFVDSTGKVTANRNATAYIVATSGDGLASDTCKVVVGYIKTTGVQFSVKQASVVLGESPTVQLGYTVSPADASFNTLTWTSDDESLATVDRYGKVTGLFHGITDVSNGNKVINDTVVNIIGTAYDGQSDTCQVRVSHIAVEDITNIPDTIKIIKGQHYVLNPVFVPSNAYFQNISWVSNVEGIATVANGRVVGVAEGTAKITAYIYRTTGNQDTSNREFKKDFYVVVKSTTDLDFESYPKVENWN